MYGLVQEGWIWLGYRNLLYFNSLQPNYTVCPCSSDVALHSCVVVTACSMFHVQGISHCLAINSSCMCICVPNTLLTFGLQQIPALHCHPIAFTCVYLFHQLLLWTVDKSLPFLSNYMHCVDCRECVGHLLIISCTVGWSSRGWP